MQEAPVGLVPCQTVDLEVPASSEIVIEGWLTTDRERFADEGPFRERIDYGRSYHMPQIEVSCICHRDNPIMVGSATGLAPIVEEQALVINAGVKAVLLNALNCAGIPNVLDLSLTPYFACQIKKAYQGHAYQVACTLFGHKALNMNYKMLLVVEDDVDLKDARALMAAINAHVDPQRDIHIFPTQRTLVDPRCPNRITTMKSTVAPAVAKSSSMQPGIGWTIHRTNPLLDKHEPRRLNLTTRSWKRCNCVGRSTDSTNRMSRADPVTVDHHGIGEPPCPQGAQPAFAFLANLGPVELAVDRMTDIV